MFYRSQFIKCGEDRGSTSILTRRCPTAPSNSPTPQPTQEPHMQHQVSPLLGPHRPSRRHAGVMLALILLVSWVVILPVMVGMFHVATSTPTPQPRSLTPHRTISDELASAAESAPRARRTRPSLRYASRSCVTGLPGNTLSGSLNPRASGTRLQRYLELGTLTKPFAASHQRVRHRLTRRSRPRGGNVYNRAGEGRCTDCST